MNKDFLFLSYLNQINIIKKDFFENSLGDETLEVLGFQTIEALENELALLTKELDEEMLA